MANRLKWVLEEVIDKAQSAFVPGRQIFDNALVAFEIVHSMKEKHTGKVGWMALKLDMSKAYDRVEWRYLEGMMRTMGFPEKFILLIMKCVSSVAYSIMINGKKCGHIKPSKGISQGDPLSPYLFLLCAEGLSTLLKKALKDKEIQGVAAARNGPKITHLFFADDSLLFCRAQKKDC